MRQRSMLLIAFIMLTGASCAVRQGDHGCPADPSATGETKRLHQKMISLLNSGIMFGHQDDLAYGIGWVYPDGESDVLRVCSDYPAVLGMDLGHLELGLPYNLDSVSFDNMRTFARQINSWGGVVTFSWHADNPLTGGNTWDISSDRVVTSVLPGGENHEKFKTWLDRLADYFLTFEDGNGKLIPLVFRPYHEHTGSWFWWGQNLCTTDEYVSLWRFTVDYLTKTRGVHNLLYAYSPAGDFSSAREYLERYPGDGYVDIIGFDYYYKPGYTEEVRGKLKMLGSIAERKGKIAALTETGYEGIPDTAWWTGSLWPAIEGTSISYVLVWRNAWNIEGHYYAPYPGHRSEKDFLEFYRLPGTLFRNDISEE